MPTDAPVFNPLHHDHSHDDDDHMVHGFCYCAPKTALCGKPLKGIDCPEGSLECVVCAELFDKPCPRCGRI